MLERIALLKRLCDTVWEYHGDSNQLYVHYDGVTPEFEGTWKPYEEIYNLYKREYVYPGDADVWEKYMSSENLKNFLRGDKKEIDFEIRVEHSRIGLEWHASYIDKVGENQLLIATRDIKDLQRNATIARAVLPEFDYVCRIDLATKGYVLYYSADEKTVVPQHSANNFDEVIGDFNRQYIVPEEVEAINEQMRLENIKEKLKDQNEFILYATSRDKNGLTYKKFRFCYADASKQEILLTRTDVSDVVRERMLRQEEEKKRVKHLEKELFLTQELHKSQVEMQHILETTTDLMFKYDPENGAVLLHKAEEEDYHQFLSEKDMLKRLAAEGYLEESYVATLEECLEHIRDGEHRLSCTIKARKNLSKDWVWYRVTLFDYQDESTHERKVLGYLQNINQDMWAKEELKKAAQRDSLTGLYNVGAAKKKIREILRNQTGNQEICNAFFLMDVDDFKSINDTKGHMIGDSTLQKFAAVLTDTFRFQDIIFRLGGDEFAVFAEELHDSGKCIQAIMERFGSNLKAAREKFPFLGISVGVYVTDRRHTYEQYYEEADKALYETKKNGKNSYTIHNDTGSSVLIRKGTQADLVAVEQLYNDIHTAEENGKQTIGWIRGVYPTGKTAKEALEAKDLFVLEEDGKVLGAARINKVQVDAYSLGKWEFQAADSEVCVLHTLVISPFAAGKGYGKQFVHFYENYALSHGCKELRMDTNARNAAARGMYKKLGYKEIGIVPTVFNGIPDVQLVLLEKHL